MSARFNYLQQTMRLIYHGCNYCGQFYLSNILEYTVSWLFPAFTPEMKLIVITSLMRYNNSMRSELRFSSMVYILIMHLALNAVV